MRCRGGDWAFTAFESFSSRFFYLDVSNLFIGCEMSVLRAYEMMGTYFASTTHVVSSYIDHIVRLTVRTVITPSSCLVSCGFMANTYAMY
jgi:hypothetical protein